MKLRMTWLLLLWWGFAAGSALAQRPGTTVQLPTFSSFSVGTTVSVPDRGSVYLGGIKRASTGRNEFRVPLLPFRPFRNTGIGRELSASSVHVTATIHDFEAMDEFLLSQPTAYARSLRSPPVGAAAAWAKTLRRRDPAYGTSWKVSGAAEPRGASAMSVAEARAQRLRQQDLRAAEAVEFFERGRNAEMAGKSGAAKVYYQMAARRATGQLSQQVVARLEMLSRPATARQIAQRQP